MNFSDKYDAELSEIGEVADWEWTEQNERDWFIDHAEHDWWEREQEQEAEFEAKRGAKYCKGCGAAMYAGDPDLCALCDLHSDEASHEWSYDPDDNSF